MTTYIDITDPETDPDAPLTSELAKKWRDNAIAIAEGDATAVVNQACWHPYNMVKANDGATGKFWDFAIDGLATTITTPTFAAGYDYWVRWVGLSHNSGSGRTIIFTAGITGAVWTTELLNSAGVVSGSLVIENPTMVNQVRSVTRFNRTNAGGNNGPAVTPLTNWSTALTEVVISLSDTGSIDAGQVFLYRRRNYAAD